MATYTVKYGQSIFDVAMQKYGSLEGVELLFRDNPSLCFDSDLQVGQLLNVEEGDVLESEVVNYLDAGGHIVSNSDGVGEFTDPSLEDQFLTHDGVDDIIDQNGDSILLNL